STLSVHYVMLVTVFQRCWHGGLPVVCVLFRDDPFLTRGLLVLWLRTEMRNSEWFEYETNVHRAAGVIVDHALRITVVHGFAPSALLDLAISFADFSPLRTK